MLFQAIQATAQSVQQSSKPSTILFGIVTKTQPLEIIVEQKLTLTEDFLLLSNAVKEHDVDVSISTYSEYESVDTTHTHKCDQESTVEPAKFDIKHRHKLSGKNKITMHCGLQKDEKVLLVSAFGGQKYLVIDRISEAKTKGDWV